MCGFIGVVTNGRLPQLERLRAARDTLSHRGPDSSGEFIHNTVYLGFRRLAILDLSSVGNQPMSDRENEVSIVLNGEIYNYVELRKTCEERGSIFRSGTDTEVVLALYRLFGVEMLKMLNGMFALAIYDLRTNHILLARDRFGKKPLFYAVNEAGLCFASELKALERLPGFDRTLNTDALSIYFRLGWIPGHHCAYTGVKKLAPSTFMEYDVDKGTVLPEHRYWTLPEPGYDFAKSNNQWVDGIEELLTDAVRIRLRSDVPVGCFLSGGVDSGIIASIAAQCSRGSVTALSVEFPGWAGDESHLARQTAEHSGVRLIRCSLEPTLDFELLSHFDEPFADPSAHPTSLICGEARKHVTVALSGDGGDEVFGGYSHYVRADRWRSWDRVPRSWRRGFKDVVTAFAPVESRPYRFAQRAAQPMAFFGLGSTIYPFGDWLADFVEEPFRGDALLDRLATFERGGSRPYSHDPVDAAQRFDLRNYMVDDILVKVDRMSMLHSLEVRSPFLDYRIVEMALRIPPHLRIQRGVSKYLLRRLAARRLPRSVAAAPKKGFGIPLYQWLFKSSQSHEIRELLHSLPGTCPAVIPVHRIGAVWDRALNGSDLAVNLIYRLLAYRAWSLGRF